MIGGQGVVHDENHDRTTMWAIFHMQSMLKMKLNCHDQSSQVRYVMKTKKDNDMTDCTEVIYTKNKTELSWPIGPGVVCDENQTWQ